MPFLINSLFLQLIAYFCCAYFQKFLFQHDDKLLLPPRRSIDTDLFPYAPLIDHFFYLFFPLRRTLGYRTEAKRVLMLKIFFFSFGKERCEERVVLWGKLTITTKKGMILNHHPQTYFFSRSLQTQGNISIPKEMRVQAPRTSIQCGPEIYYY